MSRDEGFRHADVDVGILDDAKVRALVRSCRDEGLVSRCLVAYLAAVTSSWARGERMTLEDAAPLWLSGPEDLQARLVAVGLLDADGRLPAKSWDSWFGPAVARRTLRREAGSKGGRASARSKARANLHHGSSNGAAELNQSVLHVLSGNHADQTAQADFASDVDVLD